MEHDIVIEGQDTDSDSQPDWKVRLHIKDPRLWAIVCIIIAAVAGTKSANLW